MSLLNKILFTPQTLTDDQKRIARENIGAAASATETYFDENTISGDGSQAHPYTVKPMEAATAQSNGKGGIVPAPVGGDDQFDKRVLCSNGQWRTLRQLRLLTDSDLVNILAKPYDSTSTYNVGDLVYHERKLWKCIVAIDVPKAWSGDTNWTDITIDLFNNTNPGLVPICTEQGIRILKSDGTWVEVEEYTTAYIDGLDWNLDPSEITIDNKIYKTVKLGNLIWLAEDLMATWTGLKQVNGWDESPSYIKNIDYPNTYYYNDLAISDLFNNHSNLIPLGWRLPTESDYQYLINNYSHLDLKSVAGWNPEGTNDSGLNLAPAGAYSNGGWNNSNGTDYLTTTSGRYFRIEFRSPYVRFVDWSHNYHKYAPIRLVKDVT